MPTAVAIQCVDVTTPNVPSISGRVVKGFGLTFENVRLHGEALNPLAGMYAHDAAQSEHAARTCAGARFVP